ncbi:hypothetical protein CROQUDRAFT_652287 [Cronartium quercuum f. sp. fusiforme G11]|uniref:Uncharacterized protein n=1 Tax=Cronartium quercuum f. sp. fusiforme G11 TaxID=708437 RepID=A0A9P6NQX9_9BASI|nr:hypothetical protein CROQUDRAFT_652287 [Cronartium quercuum f. sp. fusiforme G11]
MLTINPPTHCSKNGRSNVRSFLLAALHLGMVLEARVRGLRYLEPRKPSKTLGSSRFSRYRSLIHHTPHSKLD